MLAAEGSREVSGGSDLQVQIEGAGIIPEHNRGEGSDVVMENGGQLDSGLQGKEPMLCAEGVLQ